MPKNKVMVNTMALLKDKHYSCPDINCGCETEVTKGSQPGGGGNQNPRCCGKEMQRAQSAFQLCKA